MRRKADNFAICWLLVLVIVGVFAIVGWFAG